jgi:metal-dependent amidase/aminoacylase/carboxypeptidase family protein
MAESLMNMSKYVKPKAGETIKAYLSRSAKSIEHMKNVDQFFDADLASSGICQDEAFDDWVMRVAFNMDEADIEETQETLKGLAKYVKPAVGESLNDYVKRAQTMIRTI